jgi:hypothetical protein
VEIKMNNKLENNVNSIIKFITAMFSPEDIRVKHYDNPDHYSITFYFNEIDDKYFTNPQHCNPEELKESMFNRELRRYIDNFLSIKTSGLQPPDFYPPDVKYPISIYVKHIH